MPLGERVQRLAVEKGLRHLALELDAAGLLWRMGFHPSKARLPGHPFLTSSTCPALGAHSKFTTRMTAVSHAPASGNRLTSSVRRRGYKSSRLEMRNAESISRTRAIASSASECLPVSAAAISACLLGDVEIVDAVAGHITGLHVFDPRVKGLAIIGPLLDAVRTQEDGPFTDWLGAGSG